MPTQPPGSFSKSEKYFYKQLLVPLKNADLKRNTSYGGVDKGIEGYSNVTYSGRKEYDATKLNGKNRRDVWHFPTASFKGSHFAVFPLKLPMLCIEAGVPKDICTKCGTPKEWVRVNPDEERDGKTADDFEAENDAKGFVGTSRLYPTDRSCGNAYAGRVMTSCNCGAEFEPGIVLDPFIGSGTTAIAALKQGKHFVGIEQSKKYVKMALKRIAPHMTTRMDDLR